MSQGIPAIFFRYELSPIRIVYNIDMMSFPTFLVRVCAIIGGIYTVSSIFESVVRNSISILGFGGFGPEDNAGVTGKSTMKRSPKSHTQLPSNEESQSIEMNSTISRD